jgi:hypothetical protein
MRMIVKHPGLTMTTKQKTSTEGHHRFDEEIHQSMHADTALGDWLGR